MNEQEISSLNSMMSTGHVLMEMGLMTPIITDNLYAYARMMPGIKDARIEIPITEDGVPSGSITYKLIPKSQMLLRVSNYFKSKNGIIYKIGLLILDKLGAPAFSGEKLVVLTQSMLRGKYDVRFEFTKEFIN